MSKLAANLSMMYTEHAFLDRFAAAARDGFAGVEYLFPYDWPAEEIARRLADAGLTQALFNLPPGDWAAGERGLAAIPGREAEFTEGLERALDYARRLGCARVHAMAGLMPAGVAAGEAEAVYLANLRRAADRLAPHGITLLIEPINTRDIPGYFLSRTDEARRLIEAVARPNLKMQFDIYHCQVMEGDLAMRIRRHWPLIGHFQIAGNPERHEPDSGEVNYPFLFSVMEVLGYDGWVGCEYRPAAATSAGLSWARPFGIRAA
jgi:hydroxypyruvate isomerase